MDFRDLIYNLELELLEPEVRKSTEKLKELLSSDFIEFCSSGKVYHYNENDKWKMIFHQGTRI